MKEEQIHTMARLTAERIMRGEKIEDGEMRLLLAGVIISVDNLSNTLADIRGSLWTDGQLRDMFEKMCGEQRRKGECPDRRTFWTATWVGRMIAAIVKPVIMAILFVLTPGCATYEVRTGVGMNAQKELYPAVQADAAYCALVWSQFDGLGCGALVAIGCMDLSVSALVDTVFLPYDFYRWISK